MSISIKPLEDRIVVQTAEAEQTTAVHTRERIAGEEGAMTATPSSPA